MLIPTEQVEPLPKHREDSIIFQKNMARKLRALKGWGGKRIKDELERLYPRDYILSKNSFQTAIKDIDHMDIDIASEPDYDPLSRYTDSQYIYKINLICERLRQRKLKVKEAELADRLMMGFKDLDLVTAFIIIEEYYERSLKTETPQNNDLDLMVATEPWASGDDAMFYNQMRTSRNMGLPTISKLDYPESDVDLYIAFHVASVLKQHVSITGQTTTMFPHQFTSRVLNKANDNQLPLKFGFSDAISFVRIWIDFIGARAWHIAEKKDHVNAVIDLTGYEDTYKKNYQTHMHVLRAIWVSELKEKPPFDPYAKVGLDPPELRASKSVQPIGLSPAERHARETTQEANVDRYFERLADKQAEMTEEQKQELDQEDFTGDRHEETE